MRGTMVEKYKTVSPPDMDLFHVTDSVEESVDYILSRFDIESWKLKTIPTIPQSMAVQIDQATRRR